MLGGLFVRWRQRMSSKTEELAHLTVVQECGSLEISRSARDPLTLPQIGPLYLASRAFNPRALSARKKLLHNNKKNCQLHNWAKRQITLVSHSSASLWWRYFFVLATCPIRRAHSPIHFAANVLVALACNAVHVLDGLKLQLLPQSFPSAVAPPLLAETKSRRDLSTICGRL